MENATQALFIAVGVLIGILIISLGIYLFYVFGGYVADTQSQIDKNSIAQFNDKFLKYDGRDDLTIQDLITLKNYALQNNNGQDSNYDVSTDRAGANNGYIDVYYGAAFILGKSDEELLTEEMQKINNNAGLVSNRFSCNVVINAVTGRVSLIHFSET